VVFGAGTLVARAPPCHRAFDPAQPLVGHVWHGPCIGFGGPDWQRPGGPIDAHRTPSRRSGPADSAADGAWPAACARDVRRRGCRSPDHRPGAEAAAGRRRLPDQRGFVCLRAGNAGAVPRLPRGRHPPACHDGRHLCFCRPDAVDGRSTRHRATRHLRLGHRCRNLCHPCRPFHQPAAAAVSARGDRHHHPGDRALADASRRSTGPAAGYQH
jgi:hypothetical protein